MQLFELLEKCLQLNASDLHITTNMPPVARVDGVLFPLNYPVLNSMDAKKLIYSCMEQSRQIDYEKILEIDFSFTANSARFRVNVFHELQGIAAVFRIIPAKVLTFSELQLPVIFEQISNYSQGLILLTGATGSGKSTTLAAMISYINTYQARHIITIEDPIEFVHVSKKSLIRQREVKTHTQDFNSALRSALREDPDIILVGELRDLETVRLALTAAETGHLVMATLHTSSAVHAVNRIVDIFPAGEKNIIRNMLAGSLQAVIYQQLLKKEPSGRIPAFEIMLASSAIRNLIREDKIAQMYSIIQTSNEKGMCTLDQYLQRLGKGDIK